MSNYAELSFEMQQAAIATAAGESVERIMALVKLSKRTIDRWRREPAFLRAVKFYRSELFSQIVSKIGTGGCKAIDTLIKLCDNESALIQLEATKILLNACAGNIDVAELIRNVNAPEVDDRPKIVHRFRDEIADSV